MDGSRRAGRDGRHSAGAGHSLGRSGAAGGPAAGMVGCPPAAGGSHPAGRRGRLRLGAPSGRAARPHDPLDRRTGHADRRLGRAISDPARSPCPAGGGPQTRHSRRPGYPEWASGAARWTANSRRLRSGGVAALAGRVMVTHPDCRAGGGPRALQHPRKRSARVVPSRPRRLVWACGKRR